MMKLLRGLSTILRGGLIESSSRGTPQCYISQIVPRMTHLCPNIVRRMATETRNIGIMAHIDAGKTTTTERMLFYAGYIERMGDIDSGNTVMDYLPSEIERGITVQSSTISFPWLNAHVNLIDTPGHVDFTIEVERSLRVLDGAVAIFDGSKGVEAQSRTVWRQADRYNVPRIAYINKMDKPAANYSASVQSLQEQLNANTLLLQLPIYDEGMFTGVIDLVNMEKIVWDMSVLRSNHTGRKFDKTHLDETDEHWETCMAARSSIIEQLCDLYDDAACTWLEGAEAGDASAIKPTLLKQWIRRGTIDRSIVPVLCGSSFRNVGVQSLLDAVVHYLPKPSDISHSFTQYYGDSSLIAMAFKVLHDKRHGPLLLVRVYSGKIKTGMSLYNPNKSCSEKISHLMTIYANEYHVAKEIGPGGIGLVCGFKHTVTGDTLVESKEQFEEASSRVSASSSLHTTEEVADEPVSHATLAAVPIPEPVFFCTIEVQSIMQEKALNHALDVICREDPSVRVSAGDDGSIMMSGMGELHMDIVAERIRKEFKVEAYISPIQVAYREMPTQASRYKDTYSRTIVGNDHTINVDISVEPTGELTTISNVDNVRMRSFHNPTNHAAALGVIQACQKGNILGYPVMGAKFRVHSVSASNNCPPALITAAANKCTREVLSYAQCCVVEPVMEVEVSTRESSLQQIISELNKRHANVKDINSIEDTKIVVAEAPVAGMRGFSSTLRSATSGLADLSLEIIGYKPVTEDRLHKIKLELSGAVS